MSKTLRWGVTVVLMTMIVPSVATAQDFYAAVRGGPGWTPDVHIGVHGAEDAVSFTSGFTGSGAVGYASSWGLRFEGEFGYLYAPVDREEGQSVGGSIKSYLAMANAYYDLRIPSLGPFTPYVGFGIGAARVNEDRETLIPGLPGRVRVDEWRTALAYSGRLGVGYDVNKWLGLSAGYRYLHIDGGTRDGVLPGLTVHSDGVDNHSFEFGAVFKF